MNSKICGISKRHFRRCVKKEKNSIINKSRCKKLQNVEVKEKVECAVNNIDDTEQNDRIEHTQFEMNINNYAQCDFECETSIEIDEKSFESNSESAQFKLRIWYISNGITQKALKELLKLLVELGLNLPSDPRTLLNTPREVIKTKPLSSGEYYHYGLETNIKSLFKARNRQEPVSIDISIDGLPLSKSSGLCMWPILAATVNESTIRSKIFPIGIFVGTSKPDDSNEFLKEFANEYKNLENEGYVKIRLFACDAPAKSFICGTQSHQSYNGCPKCHQRGNYVNRRIAYQVQTGEDRTDETFKSRSHSEHHSTRFRNEASVLENIGVGMVSQFPVEPMHLLDLGVVKKFLTSIYDNKCLNFKLKPSE